MGIFKKTVKYSKASKDLDKKIKSLDEGLKKTGVILEQNDAETFCVEENKEENIPKIVDKIEVVKEEEQLYHWRETLLEETIEEVEGIQETHTLTRVENYISESNKELIVLRDQVFKEISEETLLNLPEIKTKISKVLEIYEQLQEGLLNEPPEVKNEDPLTPLNQKFVTLDDLNKHYSLFVNRVQEQLATLGGGGETQFKYLDDVVGIATNASAYDGKFLKYNHSLGKFEFVAVSGGGGSGDYASVAGIATYSQTAGISTYASVSGISTYSSVSGVSTYAQTAGIATSAGTATTSTYLSNAANILTGTIAAERLSSSNSFDVYGNLYVQGNVSIGGTTISLVTQELKIKDTDLVVGFTTDAFGNDVSNDTTANHGGVAVASTEGSPLVQFSAGIETTPHTYKKMMWFKNNSWTGLGTDAWLFNYGVGIGSTQVPNGVRLAAGNVKFTEFDLSTVRNVNASGIVTGSSFRPSSGFYQSANGTNGFFVFDTTGDVSFQGKIVTNFIRSNTNLNPTVTVSDLDLQFARNVTISGVTTSTGGFVGNVTGTASTAQGLTGTPNITVGIVTSDISIPTQLRTRSVAEKTSIINGNTISLVFNTGGGNVAICTNPTGDITLNVTGIPTDTSFDNHSISFSAIVQQTGTARTCTAVNLNGVSRTIKWAGGSLANAISGITTTSGYDIFTFTGINTVGSASTAANYVVLGSVNGGFN